MPAKTKNLETMTKNLTRAEKAAREQAEADCLPGRLPTTAPPSLKDNPAAKKYWRTYIKQMEGYGILDQLDTETLATYCAALARRDSLSSLCQTLMDTLSKAPNANAAVERVENVDGVLARLQTHEKNLLSYANALGLTPDSRARLARKRAAAAVEEESDGDLFG